MERKMISCIQKPLNLLLFALLSISVVQECYSLESQVNQQQKEMPVVNAEHCTYGNSDQDCAADTASAKAYPGSGSQEMQDEAGRPEDEYQDFLHRSMDRLEGMLEESRTQVLEKLRKVMDKMAHSRDRMIKKLDALLDTVSHSRLMMEIDHLLEEVSHSKIIEDMKSLPRELKESLLLSVRNRSYVAAGIMVIVTMAVLLGGSLYFAWCHHDGWSLSDDYKALGVRAVAAVTGAAKEEQGQDTEDFVTSDKEKKEGGQMIRRNEVEESGAKARNGHGHGHLNEDDERSNAVESLTSDIINKHDRTVNDVSLVCKESESKKDS